MSEKAIIWKTEAENRVAVQTWKKTGELIYQSSATDPIPRQPELGFANVEVGGKLWRVFTASDGDQFAQVGQRWSARLEIANHAALGAAVPLLAAIPIAWIVIIFGVDQLLQRLTHFSNVLALRSVEAKDPIILGTMPDEFRPIILAINGLIDKHQRAVEQQKQFVSEAAHELRTPLAALQIQIDNLESRPDDESRHAVLKELSAGIRRASAMVRQLLRMARLDVLLTTGTADIDLKELIVSVVSDFVLTSAKGGVELAMSIDQTANVRVCDADVRLLFTNLIDNAIRYTPPGGSVEVAIKQRGAATSIEIIDTGTGISPLALPRIFDRFYRAAPADIEGTGLGLAIAKKIAQRNKFQLSISNRLDRIGICAEVLIPAQTIQAGWNRDPAYGLRLS